MSASLVGSEMCIRDRDPVATTRGARGGRRASPKTDASSAANSGMEPVSYTHLTLPTICSV
eukprot:4887337-Alexandrium_andersonii.AAC.1